MKQIECWIERYFVLCGCKGFEGVESTCCAIRVAVCLTPVLAFEKDIRNEVCDSNRAYQP